MKKKTINLFIACSTTSDILNMQKNKLEKLCDELSIEFAEKGEKVTINAVAYDDMERRMLVFKRYIKHKADIVVFLVDKKLGAFLEEELDLAVKRGRQYRRPELLVYITDSIEQGTKQKVAGILEKGGWLYNIIQSTEELLTDVEKRIKGYVGSYESIRKKQHSFKFLSWFVIILFGLGAIGGIWGSIKYFEQSKALKEAESKRLLIVGGGSARKYIEDSLLCKKNGLSTKYWIYTNMPSGDAYRLLAEENMNYTKDFDSLPYYPVIISAQKAGGDEAFCGINNEKGEAFCGINNEKKEQFKDKGIVIGVYIGNDNLVVYGSNDAFDEIQIGQDSTITTKVLDSIIAASKDSLINKKPHPRMMIYTTKNNSGTKNAYDSVCNSLTIYDSICDRLNIDHLFFNIDSITGHKTKNKWLALGSEYYSPKENKYRLKVVNGDKQNISKDLYVYFMLYKDRKEKYRLPSAIENFLLDIKVADTTITSIKNINVTDKILYDNFSAIKQQ